MKTSDIKIRRTWSRNPVQRPHSSQKGKKGYRRSDTRQIERAAMGR
jgi:hypothetical protein